MKEGVGEDQRMDRKGKKEGTDRLEWKEENKEDREGGMKEGLQ